MSVDGKVSNGEIQHNVNRPQRHRIGRGAVQLHRLKLRQFVPLQHLGCRTGYAKTADVSLAELVERRLFTPTTWVRSPGHLHVQLSTGAEWDQYCRRLVLYYQGAIQIKDLRITFTRRWDDFLDSLISHL